MALFLGSCDLGKKPASRQTYLKPYHIDGLLIGKVSFRDDDRTKWRSFREGSTTEVRDLQQFLKNVGFMPRANLDGVFGYVTQAAVRLFQEYVRTIEGVSSMIPDGIVGRGTMAHVNRWKQNGIVSQWGQMNSGNPSQHYLDWMQLLQKAKTHYEANPGPVLKSVNGLQNTFSTRKVKDWAFDHDAIHLIGVRRKQTQSTLRRDNDDLFFLLINGMVFTFWGSTDSSVNMAQRDHEAFLVEGQHEYRFGWHKISVEKKIYRALKPEKSSGVLMIRDWDNDNAFTDNDVHVSLSGNRKTINVNNSINIHWTGIGRSNFSAGCQVIAGKSYINHNNELQDCSKFASTSYSGLTDSKKKTKGAYNVFTDLMLCYAKPNTMGILYTLGREESLDLDGNFGANYAVDALNRLRSV